MTIFTTHPMITGIITICLLTLGAMFIFIREASKFRDNFYEYLNEKHKEIRIEKQQGPWIFVIHEGKQYSLWTGYPFKLYRKNPEKFEDIVEAYLFECFHVDKLKIETESGVKEIPKMFS